MRKRRALWIGFVFVAFNGIGLAQESAVIDATIVQAEERTRPPKPAPEPKPYYPPCPKGKEVCPPPIYVGEGACSGVGFVYLVPKFVALEKSIHRVGEPISYVLHMENISDAAIEVPLKKSIREIEPRDPKENYSYRTGALGFLSRGKYPIHFDPADIQLWGSPQTPGSLVTLKPGEWITVKGQLSAQVQQESSDSSAAVGDGSIPPATEIGVEVAAKFVSGGREYFFDAANSTEKSVCHPTFSSPVKFTPLKLILIKNSETVQK